MVALDRFLDCLATLPAACLLPDTHAALWSGESVSGE